MTFEIDHDSPVPPFEQLRALVVAQVRRGQLIAGSKLPTVRGMAADLDIAPNTVAKAYRALEQDGVIVTRGRSGTFVASGPDPSRTAVQRAATEYVHAARRAGIGDDDAVKLVRTALKVEPSRPDGT